MERYWDMMLGKQGEFELGYSRKC